MDMFYIIIIVLWTALSLAAAFMVYRDGLKEEAQKRLAREQGELKRKRVQQQFIKSLENGGW